MCCNIVPYRLQAAWLPRLKATLQGRDMARQDSCPRPGEERSSGVFDIPELPDTHPDTLPGADQDTAPLRPGRALSCVVLESLESFRQHFYEQGFDVCFAV